MYHMTGFVCREYLQALVGYFESFYARTQPLGSLSKIYAKLGDFEAKFKAGEVPEWNDKGSGDGSEPSNVLDMTAFATVEEVESLGEPSEDTALTLSQCSQTVYPVQMRGSRFLMLSSSL